MTGVLNPSNPTIYDEPIRIRNTQTKSSWFNSGGGRNRLLNDKQALAVSSNVYMFKLAIAMGNGQYIKNEQRLILDKEKSFKEMRDHFSQFGLGVRTGIDLPGEVTGYPGNVKTAEAGKALDFAIGQFDTYTPLQLAQYVSTIANGGYRMQPRIVKEIRQTGSVQGGGDIGPLAQEMKPVVLNKVDVDESLIKRVQEGFYDVFHGTNVPGVNATGVGYYKNAPYNAAGKTGYRRNR